MKKHLLLFIAATAVFVSCNEDNGNNRVRAGADVRTGVMLNGNEIIVQNANIGANYVDDRGSYLTWDVAKVSCPTGYHLMTKAEAEALFADPAYDTGIELMTGKLRMPLTGYYDPSGYFKSDNFGFYYLWDGTVDQAYLFQFEDYASRIEITYTNSFGGNGTAQDRQPGRCVKEPAPIIAGADVPTGVMLNGKEIIVKAANIGAENVGDPGSYLTWEEARTSCPDGYHLMTEAEAEALFANPAYNTGAKLISGNLHMPLTGYYRSDDNTISGENFGNYYLWDEDGNEAYYFYFENNVNSINIDSYNKTDRQPGRCVKGPEPQL